MMHEAQKNLLDALRQPSGGLRPSNVELLERLSKARIHDRPFINGRFVSSTEVTLVDNLCPINGVPINRIALSTADDISLAVKAAKTAAEAGLWAKDLALRKRVLHRIADLIE